MGQCTENIVPLCSAATVGAEELLVTTSAIGDLPRPLQMIIVVWEPWEIALVTPRPAMDLDSAAHPPKTPAPDLHKWGHLNFTKSALLKNAVRR